MNKKQKTAFIGALVILVTVGLALWGLNSTQKAVGGAGSIAARPITATSSTIGPVGPGLSEGFTIFSEKPNCSSRVITTKNSAIYFIPFDFDDNEVNRNDFASSTMSGNLSFLQSASTTVAYDASLWGCGRWSAGAYATTTITTSELQ